MAGQILTLVVFAFALLGSYKLVQLYRNYRIARRSGFPVFLSPVYFSDPLWMTLGPLVIPLLKLLPQKCTQPWLSISQMFEVWKEGHRPFEVARSDTFILATPNGNILWTSDGTVIHEILTKHPQFQLATELVEFFKICGPNIGVTEGEEWKTYRKIVTSGLGSSINTRTWHESITQTEQLIDHWKKTDDGVVKTMSEVTSKLALHILAHEFFDVKMDWNEPAGSQSTGVSEKRLTFDRALSATIQYLPIILMTPGLLLDNLPIKTVRDASTGFKETRAYLDELQDKANSRVKDLADIKNKSLLEAIVVAGADSEITQKQAIPSESVQGNLFFTLVAGHHTLGSIMGFIFVFLAVYPDAQRRLQEELDEYFNTRGDGEFNFASDVGSLQKGYLGAIQKEVVAMYNPVQFIPRIAARDVTIVDAANSTHIVPAGTLSMINLPAASQNPIIWPKQPRDDDLNVSLREKLSHSPALYFNPERWLELNTNGVQGKKDAHDRDSTTWFSFSQGPRSCPGRSFAQVEMTAVMATFFRDHSLELVVSDETLSQFHGERDLAYSATRQKAIGMLYDDIEFLMGLKLKHNLPIKIKPRPTRTVSH